MFADAIQSILSDRCSPAAVRAIERGGSARLLADAISGAGFHELLAPEDHGGGGLAWADFFDIAVLCGKWAVPIPLLQTMTTRLLLSEGEVPPEGLITFAPTLTPTTDGGLSAPNVGFARTADHVLGAVGDSLVLLPVVQAIQGANRIHGSLAGSLAWNPGAGRVLNAGVPADRLQPLAALLHAALLAGAMERALDMSIAYANERVQFGKSIGKFQAIQHQLGVMAEQVAASRMATEAAFATRERLPKPQACAVAKARCSEAAQGVASIAHAVHGAMGVTEEYDLQLYTRRLHEWRMAHGSESHWHRVLGRLFLESEPPLAADFARSLT